MEFILNGSFSRVSSSKFQASKVYKVYKMHKVNLIFLVLIKSSVCDYLYPSAITTTALPEIIINKQLPSHSTSPNSFSGYYYPQPPSNILPPFPPLQNEIPIENGYIPPSNQYLPPYQQDIQSFQPVPIGPHSVYGSATVPKTTHSNVDPPIDSTIRVISMYCLDTADNRFFKAAIQSPDFITTPPIFTKSTSGCTIFKKTNDIFVINLDGFNVGNCGVKYCGLEENKKLCLNLRLPTVPGLQLFEDRMITLQCAPQHSVASVVRSLGIKAPQKVQPRTMSFNTIASGGSQRAFRPQLTLYRKGNQLVESGSSVLLGEDLFIKATIPDQEDWKFSKMGTVIIQQGIQNAGERRSIILVDNDGCRAATMKSVCPNHPEQINNKVTVMPFKAFLFQDVESDEMLISVRIFGCMYQKDCQQTRHCEEKVASSTLDASRNSNLGRRKRSMVNRKNSTHAAQSHKSHQKNINDLFVSDNNGDMQDYESHLDFRVVLPRMMRRQLNFELKNNSLLGFESNRLEWSVDDVYNGYLFVSIVLIFGLGCIALLCVVVKVFSGSKPDSMGY